MKLFNRLVNRIHRLAIAIISAMLAGNVLAQPIGSCDPVDYYHVKILDADKHLDSWHKDVNGKDISSYTWDDKTNVLVIDRSSGSNVTVKLP